MRRNSHRATQADCNAKAKIESKSAPDSDNSLLKDTRPALRAGLVNLEASGPGLRYPQHNSDLRPGNRVSEQPILSHQFGLPPVCNADRLRPAYGDRYLLRARATRRAP